MKIIERNVVQTFDRVMECFVDGEVYKRSPPTGPQEELATLSVEELKAIQQTVYGEDLQATGYSYSHIKIIEDPQPKPVEFPKIQDLENLNVCGIDGSSQRVERATFYFILARASIVEFRYSTVDLKPYFYNQTLDASAILWVDGNVFSDRLNLFTQSLKTDNHGRANILAPLAKDRSLPFLVKHDPTKIDKSPSSHAIGWAVKLQQGLELECLKKVPTDVPTVCIKDGPLFSTSVSPRDTLDGLYPIFAWNHHVLIAVSKRVKDSSLLVEALQKNIPLRDFWFKDQNINDQTLRLVSTDSIILPRILKPGYRTPLMEALPVSRKAIVEDEPRLMPLSCYYLSRHRPHTYIRLEIPKFMYDKNAEQVEKAISVVCWQHELGHKAPLVQVAADERCQLQHEKTILERQTISHLHKNNLHFPEDY
ncbi:DNA double-strand break repair nuclease NurA [Neolewinella lacunae]|uniref:DNA double-strand break repair nuclease NurA n=1 Tax=Neolewinella lacunae TaxID=1517758 RepID=A0A923PGD0_9BACT|nr:DNA double-strand break repair nuclease NurA [Neolewinella lacunae]MBC6993572.1 DNA double-strand break repair nuclease NurA [Neolewinella lacunae]MDN3636153.1 DNA double-strand break repair nuclease NurA [Neolewinella lacunae]